MGVSAMERRRRLGDDNEIEFLAHENTDEPISVDDLGEGASAGH
tara:strand:- start:338 stop:469 length:132 start_codon:yes stop_codon:yes gene_type:complete